MKIKVQILDEIQEIDVNKDTAYVGSNSSCDIFLEYEGIGEKHLKLEALSDKIIVEELGSGFSTFVNDIQIEPLSKFDFFLDTEIEVGGIVLTNISKNVTAKSTGFTITFDQEESFKSEKKAEASEDGEEDVDALMQQLSKQNVIKDTTEIKEELFTENVEEKVESEQKDRKKFRPQLYHDPSVEDSESTEFKFKRKKINVKQSKKQYSKKIKNVKSQKRKNLKRRSRKVHASKNQKSKMLSTMIFFVGIFISISIYYFNIYEKKLKREEAQSRKVVEKVFVDSFNQKINERKKEYLEYANSQKCDEAYLKPVCRVVEYLDEAEKPMSGAKIINNVLYIGISRDTFYKNISVAIKKDKINEEELLKTVENEYKDYITVKKFKDDYFSARVPALQFLKVKFEYSLFLMHLLIPTKIEIPKQVTKIHSFIYESYLNEFKVMDYFEFDKKHKIYKEEITNDFLHRIGSIWHSYLSKDVEDFVSSYGSTSKSEFNIESLNEEFAKSTENLFSEVKNLPKCVTESSYNVCSDIQSRRESKNYEGFIKKGNILFYVLDLKLINTSIKKDSAKLSGAERKERSVLMSKIGIPENKAVNIVRKNGMYNLSEQEKSLNLLLLDTFKNKELNSILENSADTQLKFVILGVKEAFKKISLSNAIIFDVKGFKSIYKASILENNLREKYFKSNSLPVYQDTLQKANQVLSY